MNQVTIAQNRNVSFSRKSDTLIPDISERDCWCIWQIESTDSLILKLGLITYYVLSAKTSTLQFFFFYTILSQLRNPQSPNFLNVLQYNFNKILQCFCCYSIDKFEPVSWDWSRILQLRKNCKAEKVSSLKRHLLPTEPCGILWNYFFYT